MRIEQAVWHNEICRTFALMLGMKAAFVLLQGIAIQIHFLIAFHLLYFDKHTT